MGGLQKKAERVAAFLQKYKFVLGAAGLYHAATWTFDNILWMLVELKWGGAGALCMMAGAFAINSVLLVFFRNRKTEFILWSFLDDLSEREHEYRAAYNAWKERDGLWRLYLTIASYIPVRALLFALWLMKRYPYSRDFVAFFFLSIVEDPFITTVYLRHGRLGTLQLKDYLIYFASSGVSIGYWAARNALIVEFALRPIVNLF